MGIIDDFVELRKVKRVSQKELAKRVGISPSQLRNIEKCRSGVNLQMMEKMADSLGFELVAVFRKK